VPALNLSCSSSTNNTFVGRNTIFGIFFLLSFFGRTLEQVELLIEVCVPISWLAGRGQADRRSISIVLCQRGRQAGTKQRASAMRRVGRSCCTRAIEDTPPH
jgi:hypothetical protein